MLIDAGRGGVCCSGKPPGYEKWTWGEIRAGRKMSKSEKRMRRLGKNLGATEDESGNIIPPKGNAVKGSHLLSLFWPLDIWKSGSSFWAMT